MRNTIVRTCLLLVSIGAPLSLTAAAKSVAVTPKVSTLGVGADVAFKIRQRLSLRITGQQYDYKADGEVDGVEYDADLNLQSFGTMVDFFPTSTGFRITAGVLANGNELNSSARLDPLTAYDIGDESFTGAQLGDIDGSVTFAAAAPFAGVGWGNPFGDDSRFSFSADLGVAHQPIDRAELRSTNPFANALIDQEIENEEQRFRDEVERLEFYPVISVGLTVLF